ncbi:MAG: LysE family transporter [Telmatospirillum sp.]|nr:LysE family transporter [Telmatospirillum sp.]
MFDSHALWIAAALQGLGLSAGLILAAGPQNAFILRQGLLRQHVGTVVAIAAFCDVMLIAAGAFGLATLLAAQPALLGFALWGGAAFLVCYALFALRRALDFRAGIPTSQAGAASRAAAAAASWALALLNPHVYLDTVVLLGTVASSFADMPARIAFAAGASAISIVWFAGIGYGARLLAPIFAKPIAWRIVDVSVAAIMATVAASLVRAALAA